MVGVKLILLFRCVSNISIYKKYLIIVFKTHVINLLTNIFGGISIGFSFIYLNTEVSNTIIIFALGLFFILIGFFFIKFTNDNRIEYNNKEIKQYLMLRKKPRVIKWNELNRIEYKNIGSLLVLKSEHTVIYVDLRFDGISSLIKFISSKAGLKNVEGFDKVFSNKC